MSAIGAIIGLILAIVLIIRKVSPCYSLLLGALVGGLVGGLGLTGTVGSMIGGIKDITPAIIRILAAGVLSGVLIQTGAAESIAKGFIRTLGAKHIYWALALSTLFLCAVGVFIDVAVITVAPIALLIAKRTGHSESKLLLMMIGGGKAGNIISPNPNTIIAAENFGADLYSVMIANIIPAIVGLLFTVLVLSRLFHDKVNENANLNVSENMNREDLPSFISSISGPLIAIALLALRPVCGIVIDPLIALPAGGLNRSCLHAPTQDVAREHHTRAGEDGTHSHSAGGNGYDSRNSERLRADRIPRERHIEYIGWRIPDSSVGRYPDVGRHRFHHGRCHYRFLVVRCHHHADGHIQCVGRCHGQCGSNGYRPPATRFILPRHRRFHGALIS